MYNIDCPRYGVVYNFGHVCLSVCRYVCQTITFESFDVGSSYLHILCSYMKVIRSKSRSQKQKSKKKSLFWQRKTLIGHNPTSMKHRTMRLACSMVLSDMADWVAWPPSLSHDRKWPCLTTCMHSWVVGLTLEGRLVLFASYVRFRSWSSDIQY